MNPSINLIEFETYLYLVCWYYRLGFGEVKLKLDFFSCNFGSCITIRDFIPTFTCIWIHLKLDVNQILKFTIVKNIVNTSSILLILMDSTIQLFLLRTSFCRLAVFRVNFVIRCLCFIFVIIFRAT